MYCAHLHPLPMLTSLPLRVLERLADVSPVLRLTLRATCQDLGAWLKPCEQPIKLTHDMGRLPVNMFMHAHKAMGEIPGMNMNMFIPVHKGMGKIPQMNMKMKRSAREGLKNLYVLFVRHATLDEVKECCANSTVFNVDLYTLRSDPAVPSIICEVAAASNRLDVLQWAHSEGYSLQNVVFKASERGFLHILRWVVDHDFDNVIYREAGVTAARNGHVDVVEWIWHVTKLQAANTAALEAAAASHANYPLTEPDFTPGPAWDFYEVAISNGRVNVLKWLNDHCEPLKHVRYPHIVGEIVYGRSIIALAAYHGFIPMIKFLLEHGCELDEYVAQVAAERGHFEALRWLRSRNCPLDSGACTGAAQAFRLDILQWLRAEGCPWDENTCFFATCNPSGNPDGLEILKWARAHGCPWNIQECFECARRYHLVDVIAWILPQLP